MGKRSRKKESDEEAVETEPVSETPEPAEVREDVAEEPVVEEAEPGAEDGYADDPELDGEEDGRRSRVMRFAKRLMVCILHLQKRDLCSQFMKFLNEGSAVFVLI